jgi:2-keto-4-pentenoate hydratase/2-oxohepta-3-ene-1,7-dioic acid hydratase in catechol pathway
MGRKTTAFVRFLHQGRWRYGLLGEGEVVPLRGSIFGRWEKAGRALPLEGMRLGPPCRPSKIVAVGVNYRAHAREMGHSLPPNPKIFLKPPTAAIGPGETICCPPMAAQVDYEAELAVVIGRKARNVPREESAKYIFGATCLNDVTARDLQKVDGQWTRAKSFDTFAPVGPAIVTGLDLSSLVVESYLNGERRQSAPTADLIFPVEELVHFISGVMTLLPGDVIATGTPEGVGPMSPGDRVEVRIEGIGSLVNPVGQ